MTDSEHNTFTKTVLNARLSKHNALYTVLVVLASDGCLVQISSLSGEVGLIALNILAADHHHICWHLLSIFEVNEVADDELLRVNGDGFVTVAEHFHHLLFGERVQVVQSLLREIVVH